MAIRKRTKADQRREQQRRLLFSNVTDDQLWSHKFNGWAWVPRTMPLILQLIRLMSKGASAAETYFSLWCHCISESVVEMNNMPSLIISAGYSGPTAERTWKERMKKLEELGFIKIASGKYGDMSCVLILNPHKVLQKHQQKKSPPPGFDQRLYNCVLEHIADYSMRDFEPPKNVVTSPLLHLPSQATAKAPARVAKIARKKSK
jgi:hypothetical protein